MNSQTRKSFLLLLILSCAFACTLGELFSDNEQLLERTLQQVPYLEPDEISKFSKEPYHKAISQNSIYANWTEAFQLINYSTNKNAVLPKFLKATPSCSALGPTVSPHECICYQSQSSKKGSFCHYEHSKGVCADFPSKGSFWSTYEPSQNFRTCRDHVWLKYQSHIHKLYMPELTRFPHINSTSVYDSMVRRVFENGVYPVNSMKKLTATPHHMYGTGSVHASIVGKSHDILRVAQVMIREAQDEIIFVDCYFQPQSEAALLIRKALLDLNAKRRQQVLEKYPEQSTGPLPEQKIKIYLLFKKNTLGIRKRLVIAPKNLEKYSLPTPDEAPFLDIKLTLFHKFPVGTLHSKLMVVDRHAGLMLSSNVEDVWFSEIAFHVEGEIVSAMQDHFWGMWSDSQLVSPRGGSHTFGRQIIAFDNDADRFKRSMRAVDFKPLFSSHGKIVFHEVYKSDAPSYPVRMSLVGHPLERNYFRFDPYNPQNSAFLSALMLAKHNVTIRTPNMNSKRLLKAITKAVARNVTVSVMLTLTMNDLLENMPLQGGDNLRVAKNLYAMIPSEQHKNLQICWFSGKTLPIPVLGDRSHIKFLAVDDEVTIVGSGNQDTQSWYHSQEVNMMIDSPPLTKLWLTMMKEHGYPEDYCFPNHLLASPSWTRHLSSGYSHDKSNNDELLNHLKELQQNL